MADYFTLKSIAKRLGYATEVTILRLIRQKGLPAYKRRTKTRDRWYTNDDLIRIWELSMAEQDRQKLIAGNKHGPRRKAVMDSTIPESHVFCQDLSCLNGILVTPRYTEESQTIEKVDK